MPVERRVASAVLLAGLLLFASPARAEPTAHDRAAESFQQARAAFARREFTAAAAAFEQAAEYEPHPVAWLDAAEAWEKADEPTKAATDCDRALLDPAATSVHKKEAEARLERLSRRVATLQITGEGRASLDGGAPFALPAKKRTTAGTHVVAFLEANQRVEVAARVGETVTAEPKPAAAPPPAPAAPPAPAPAHQEPPSRGAPTASIVLFGVGAAGAVATTVFAARTVSAHDDFDKAPTNATRDAFYRERLATNIALGVTAIALGVGVALWVLAPTHDDKRASLRPWQGLVFR